MSQNSLTEPVARLADALRAEWADARIEIERFSSGATDLGVWRDSRFFLLRYSPSYRVFDVAEVTDEHAFDAGPCEVFSDLDAAAARLREIVAAPVRHVSSRS